MEDRNHTFAICAYQESPYLEACIKSLLDQTVPSHIILATSTPNPSIRKLCEKYKIPLFVNEGETGITQDWNFAYSCCRTDFVTIAHQDDIYEKEYTECVLARMQKAAKPLIAFTDYAELREGKKVYTNKLLNVKRLMLTPLRLRCFEGSRFVRRRILAFGCPICCPSVMYARKNLPAEIFLHGFRSNEDWQAWERVSRQKGKFIYVRKTLTCHRIHGESETSKVLGENARSKEDYVMFHLFWPKPIARFLTKLYAQSAKSNEL